LRKNPWMPGSSPGMTSTVISKKPVDARHKAGHDGRERS
jgi:hypothetical protein